MFTIVSKLVGKVACAFGYHIKRPLKRKKGYSYIFQPWECTREGCGCYLKGCKIPPMPAYKPTKES